MENEPRHTVTELRGQWQSLMEQLQNPTGSDRVFQELMDRYSAPNREGRDQEYLLDRLSSLTSRHPEVALAVWFGDAQYDPGSSSNSTWSASIAKLRIKSMNLEDELAEKVSELIEGQ